MTLLHKHEGRGDRNGKTKTARATSDLVGVGNQCGNKLFVGSMDFGQTVVTHPTQPNHSRFQASTANHFTENSSVAHTKQGGHRFCSNASKSLEQGCTTALLDNIAQGLDHLRMYTIALLRSTRAYTSFIFDCGGGLREDKQ